MGRPGTLRALSTCEITYKPQVSGALSAPFGINRPCLTVLPGWSKLRIDPIHQALTKPCASEPPVTGQVNGRVLRDTHFGLLALCLVRGGCVRWGFPLRNVST